MFLRNCVLVVVLTTSWFAIADNALADQARGRRPFNEVVESRLRPQLERLLQQLVKEGRSMQIDGTPVFNGSDKFLPGKIALAMSDLIAILPANDPRLAQHIADFRSLAKLTVDDPNDSWGIYYYLSALTELHRAGRLKAAVDPLTLAKLRVRLDWRSFVDVDTYALIDHANNYYCVAFAIARLRNSLGWEDTRGAEQLYAAMTAHYREHSGPYGFADETDGEGRFDRYSVLLAGEIAQRFLETGGQPPAEILDWLRKSVDVMLVRLNARGEGFEYGRSLGPYGDTSIVEVLTAAAALDLLDENQKALAYAYASRVAERYVDFWIDRATGSINLWDNGRRTDAYRGKFRVLGENLSIGHQLVYTNATWNRIGFRNKPPMKDFESALARLPRRTVTWFARGEYDRLLLTLREGERIISLPLINGGAGQHLHSPYFPIPFSNGLLSGVPDGKEPLLTPRFELADGSMLMPLAYFRDVKVEEGDRRTVVTYRQGEMDRVGGQAPMADKRLSVSTTYIFEPGMISRTDVYTPTGKLAVKGVTMAFGSFSAEPTTAKLTTRFASGDLQEFSVTGLDSCESGAVGEDIDYRVPTGPMASKVICKRGSMDLQRPLTLSWRLRYKTN
jgi:hypothetical protein